MKFITKRTGLIPLILFVIAFAYSLISIYKILTSVAPDFQVYYQSAEDVLKKVNLYTDGRIVYKLAAPPNGLPLFIPFTTLPYNLAQGLFTILSFISIFVIVYIALKLIEKKTSLSRICIFASLTLISFPTKFTLGMGQVNLIAYALLILSLYFLHKKKDRMSGILLGLSILLKPIFVFMLLFYLSKKAWRIIIIAGLIVLLSSLAVVFIYGWSIYSYYINTTIPNLFNLSGREIYYNQGLTGFISRLTPDLQIRKIIPTSLSLVLVGYLIFNLVRNNKRELANLSLSLIILVLIDTWSWQHHFVFLIFPFILIATKAIKSKSKLNLLLFLISYLLISINIKNPESYLIFPVNLILSHVFLGTLIILFLNIYTFNRE